MPWDADLEGTLEMQTWIGLQYCSRWNLWFDSFFKWWCRYFSLRYSSPLRLSSLNKADQIFQSTIWGPVISVLQIHFSFPLWMKSLFSRESKLRNKLSYYERQAVFQHWALNQSIRKSEHLAVPSSVLFPWTSPSPF